jgi:SAM-dependent methyltransferase
MMLEPSKKPAKMSMSLTHTKPKADGWGEQLDEWLRGDQYRHYARLRILEDLHTEQPFSSMLDIGCGTGHILKHYIAKGVTGVGIDNSPTITEYHANQQWFPASRADVNSMPFQNQSFDMVTCFGLIEHLDKPIESLAEIRRVTKPGGRAMITVPRLVGVFPILVPFWYMSGGRYRHGWQNMVGRMYTRKRFHRQLQDAGWIIESLCPFKGSSVLEWLNLPYHPQLATFIETNPIARSIFSIMHVAICRNTGDLES